MLGAYARNARLFPAVLAALPALVLCAGAGFLPSTAGVVSAAAAGACCVVLCGFVRGAGQAVQATSWASSGGSPTQRAMRFSGAPSSTAIERLHARVTRATGIALPSADKEREDPAAADELYDEAIAALRELTRDATAHPLVAAENTEYGFRRNCLGVKPWALRVAGIVLLAIAVIAATGNGGTAIIPAAIASLLGLAFWTRAVTEEWVHVAADQYAKQLLASAEIVRPPG